MWRVRWGCAVVLWAGCKKLDAGARETFSLQFSCPEERLAVTARADVDAYALRFASAMPKPPPEVSVDPARLAVWQRDQDRARAAWNGRFTAFQVRGCEHQETYLCAHPDAEHGENLAAVACAPAPSIP